MILLLYLPLEKKLLKGYTCVLIITSTHSSCSINVYWTEQLSLWPHGARQVWLSWYFGYLLLHKISLLNTVAWNNSHLFSYDSEMWAWHLVTVCHYFMCYWLSHTHAFKRELENRRFIHMSGALLGVIAMAGTGWASLHEVSHRLVVAPEILYRGTRS